jgi:putative chitinase
MGNENEGDAWKYRGRGYFQITGKDNYNLIDTVCMSKLGFRFEYAIFPELLLTPSHATISLLAFYHKRLRSASDFEEFTHRLTGGLWDYERREKILGKMNKMVEVN